MTKEKVLEAHPDKFGIVLLGSKKFRRKAKKRTGRKSHILDQLQARNTAEYKLPRSVIGV